MPIKAKALARFDDREGEPTLFTVQLFSPRCVCTMQRTGEDTYVAREFDVSLKKSEINFKELQ